MENVEEIQEWLFLGNRRCRSDMSVRHWCEAGVGAFDLIDDDKVCLTNLNRQIIATRKTVGKYKTDVMKERMLEINPNVDVHIHKCFFLPEKCR